jgi:hypothetical protein
MRNEGVSKMANVDLGFQTMAIDIHFPIERFCVGNIFLFPLSTEKLIRDHFRNRQCAASRNIYSAH